MIRVVIADDHAIFRQGLAELIGQDSAFEVVGLAADGKEALKLAKSLRPDILILDITMPGLDGFQVAERIGQEKLGVRIVFLSMHKDTLSVRRGKAVGVEGFVLKEEAFDDLLYALRAVARGDRFLSPGAQAVLEGGPETGERAITPREKEVAVMIARGMSTKVIAHDLGISVKTVETHRQRIMEKLGCHKATEIAAYVVKMGWVE